MRSFTRRSMALLALALAGCNVDDVDAVSSNEQSVQWEAMSGQFEVVQDGSRASMATGAVRVPMYQEGRPLYDDTGTYRVRGTCGLTFISPHYAITAAHCVDANLVLDPEKDTLTVEQYKVSGVDESMLRDAGTVTGAFPNYQRVKNLEELAAEFRITYYQCKLNARCGLHAWHCSDAIEGDIAMLECPGRENDAAWLHVAKDAPHAGPVEMYWFHEVLDMPVMDNPSDPVTHDRFEHYTANSQSNHPDNFHYLDSDANLLLPLKSIPWSDGKERTRVGNNFTDMFGCHGTSGSGVLQRTADDQLELVGPAIDGGDLWVHSRLCQNPYTFSQGQQSVSYTSNEDTWDVELEFGSIINADRLGNP